MVSRLNFAKLYMSLMRRRKKMCTLYEDDFVSLNEYTLTVRNYHFPSKRDRKIPADQITVVYFEDQDTSKYSTTRTWGKAVNSIWWAFDLKRELHNIPGVHSHRANVVVEIGGQDVKIGFSVADIDAFMEAMRGLLDYHVIIVNSINL